MTVTVTDNFADERAAISYGATQGLSAATVRDKIANGEWHLGPPPINIAAGEMWVMVDGGLRYAIET